jgi:hypothetical protein
MRPHFAQQDCIRFAAKAARATKNRSRAAPLVRFSLRHIFGVAGTASQFPYRNPKNVVYNFYVVRNTT